MKLWELFEEVGQDGMIDDLRGQVMDYLTPLAAKKVEFVPIQSIEQILVQARTGLIIDRTLIMQLLDPNVCKLVSKVEGDKVYLAAPIDKLSAKTDDDAERDKVKISDTATKVAKDSISS